MKPIDLKYRKLGQHKALGLAWKDKRLAEVDIRLVGLERLTIICHEIFHVQNPTWSEIKVEGHSKQLAELIWEQGYRKIEL